MKHTQLLTVTLTILLFAAAATQMAYALYATTDPWQMWRHDNTRSGIATGTAPNNNNTIWTSANLYLYGNPIVAEGKVFTATSNKMYALDETTGVMLWQSFTFTGSAAGTPTYANGKIYIGTTSGYVYAINPADGTKLWERQVTAAGQIQSSTIAYQGKVYAATTDNYIYALNASNGLVKWWYQAGGAIYSSPAISGNMLYFGCDDYKIYALDISSDLGASVVWTYLTKGMVRSTPNIANGILYIGSSYADHAIFALNATTTNPYGQLLWKFQTTTSIAIDTSVAFLNNVVYFTAYQKAYALNALAPSANYTEPSPIIMIWSTTVNYYPNSPAIADGKMFFATSYGNMLYALSITDGTVLWTRTFTYAPNEPIVADDRIFIQNYYNVFALGTFYPPQTYYYTVTPVPGFPYTIQLVIANATPSATIDTSLLALQKKINFTTMGIDFTQGFTNITVPNDMLGGPYTVRIDGGLPSPAPVVVSNGTHSSIYFSYPQSTHKIEITGTTAIPEYTPTLMLPLIMAATAAMAFLAKRKLQKK